MLELLYVLIYSYSIRRGLAFMDDNDPSKIAHFETVDYAGRNIFCSLIEWEHVCRRPHEYMEDEEQEVIDALANPDDGIRYIDCDYPLLRRVYYMTHIPKKCYVKVVVEFDDEKCKTGGKIVTAYEKNNRKDCEKPEPKDV